MEVSIAKVRLSVITVDYIVPSISFCLRSSCRECGETCARSILQTLCHRRRSFLFSSRLVSLSFLFLSFVLTTTNERNIPRKKHAVDSQCGNIHTHTLMVLWSPCLCQHLTTHRQRKPMFCYGLGSRASCKCSRQSHSDLFANCLGCVCIRSLNYIRHLLRASGKRQKK